MLRRCPQLLATHLILVHHPLPFSNLGGVTSFALCPCVKEAFIHVHAPSHQPSPASRRLSNAGGAASSVLSLCPHGKQMSCLTCALLILSNTLVPSPLPLSSAGGATSFALSVCPCPHPKQMPYNTCTDVICSYNSSLSLFPCQLEFRRCHKLCAVSVPSRQEDATQHLR